MPEQYVLLVQIDQFTEIPLPIGGIEERLAWMRNWSSWRELKFRDLPLFHLQTWEQELQQKTSFIATDLNVKASSIEGALIEAFEKASQKLNLLSFLTGLGFVIISVNPALQAVVDNSRRAKLGRKLLRRVEQISWEARMESQSTTNQNGLVNVTITPGQRKLVASGPEGFQPNAYEIIGDIREKNAKRQLPSLPIGEIQKRWSSLLEAYTPLPGDEKKTLNRAFDLYRASRMSRDVFSRYVLIWTALDSTTRFLEAPGRAKTDGMAAEFGQINGMSNLKGIMYELLQTRNDIAHSRRDDESFPAICKSRLFVLEWIFSCYLYKRMGLPQLPEIGAPKFE